MIWIFFLLLAGCASPYDLGNGRYAVTRVSEERSPFGTNVAWTRLEDCAEVREEQPNGNTRTVYKDCHPLSRWEMASSQGQGGQIAAGALIGLGFGLGSAFGPSSSTSSSSSSSAVSSGAAHGHGGK